MRWRLVKPLENIFCTKFRQTTIELSMMTINDRKIGSASLNDNEVDLASPLQIGELTCRNRVFLAPMSGISDVAFRKLAWKFGAGLVFSEMVASEALIGGEEEMAMKAQSAGLPIHAVQIAGRQAKWMALAARMAQDNGANLIDINMGCPARRVTSGFSGSALMCDLDHALSLIEAVVGAVKVPVTLKMRLGWDENSINAPQLAARAQSAGVQMISVHGRTRCQFYKGNANWSAIEAVRNVTTLPLVVNGDIANINTAQQALTQSKADAVMVGRACYGAPWLPGYIAHATRDTRDITVPFESADTCGLVLEHFEEVLMHYGKKNGIRQFRKHLGWYLDRRSKQESISPLRRLMMTSQEPARVRELISRVYCQPMETLAA
jgi:tRNA-dihydrouridine synthase B